MIWPLLTRQKTELHKLLKIKRAFTAKNCTFARFKSSYFDQTGAVRPD